MSIPYLFTEKGTNSTTNFKDPYQSIGSYFTNHLAGKMLMSQLPPSTKFYRLRPSEKIVNTMREAGGEAAINDLDAALAKIELQMMRELEGRNLRVPAFQLFRFCIVGGNGLVHLPENKPIRLFSLEDYIVDRDGYGEAKLIIVKQKIKAKDLPSKIRDYIKNLNPKLLNLEEETDLEHYIKVERNGNHWVEVSEVAGVEITETRATYPLDACPWIPVRWTAMPGENYGRAKMDDDIGDLRAVEGLHKGIVEVSLASAKTLFFVRPNGQTDPNQVINARNLDVIFGNAEDVTILRVDKTIDLTVSSETATQIERRLARSYLVNSAVQRDAERVTKAEILYLANELESNLGGVYSLFAAEFQMPLVKALLHQMMRAKKIPYLKQNAINPTIVTGIDALGRTHDLEKLRSALLSAAEILNTPGIAQAVHADKLIERFLSDMGASYDGILKTREEMAQDQALAREQALAERAAGPAAGAAARMVQGETQ